MKRALWISLLLAACGTPPTPRAPREPTALVRADIDRAEEAEKARRHDLARAAYEQAIRDAHDPRSERFARREFAETLETWGEIREAITQLERIVIVAPGDAASWHDLGLLRHQEGDDEGAFAALARARQLAPHDFRPRVAIAALHWKRATAAGDPLTRRRELEAALEEYRALDQLDLPERLRKSVRWALATLPRLLDAAGAAPAPAPAPAS